MRKLPSNALRNDMYDAFIGRQFRDDDAGSIREDSAERVFFANELRSIDTDVYGMLMPALKMRSLVPTQGGIRDFDNVYEYRTSSGSGQAQVGGASGDDVPMVEVSGTAVTFQIKKYTLGYYYDEDEIMGAMAYGKPLDADRAMTCRRGLEERVDLTLAKGDSTIGAYGLLNVPGVTAYTLATKAKGGTGWGVVGAPNATGKEAAADVMGLASAIVTASKETIAKVVIAMPLAKKQFLEQTPYQNGTDKTVMQYIMANSTNIEAIESLSHCEDYGGAGVHRMVGYERNRRTIAAIVNREYTPKPPSPKNYRWNVIASMKCGGMACRYKVGVQVADGL